MIIATAMQKGGVGKTTTTLALGSELARSGARVLIIDIDPQASATSGSGLVLEPNALTIYEVLINPLITSHAIITTDHGYDLIPASLNLAGAELSLAGQIGRELLLRTVLTPLREHYDYILIDSPPSLGLFTVNALAAADTVLIPLQAHVFALQAMAQLESTIALIRQLNPHLAIGGVLLTMIDRRTSVNALVESEARSRYSELVFETTIPMSVKMVEAPAAGQPISTYATDSAGAQAYRALACEVRDRWPHST